MGRREDVTEKVDRWQMTLLGSREREREREQTTAVRFAQHEGQVRVKGICVKDQTSHFLHDISNTCVSECVLEEGFLFPACVCKYAMGFSSVSVCFLCSCIYMCVFVTCLCVSAVCVCVCFKSAPAPAVL